MPIDETKCCNTHSKEKEDNGTCCQKSVQEKDEQQTYEYAVKTGPEPTLSQLLQEGMKLQRRLEEDE
jgi:hypothetical protein|tara:strand:+ start:248 stop:448 length:201 start_codon:yes stop_codon:yes gene_type:complete